MIEPYNTMAYYTLWFVALLCWWLYL